MALLQDVELVDRLIASYPEYVKIEELVGSGAVTQGVICLHTPQVSVFTLLFFYMLSSFTPSLLIPSSS